jgi:hypothetical protein
LLCKEEGNRYLKVPLADLVAKGKHTKEYAGTTEDYGYRKEYAFGEARSIRIEGTLPLVITHEEEAEEIDTN